MRAERCVASDVWKPWSTKYVLISTMKFSDHLMCSRGRGPCQGAAAGDCIHALGAVGTPAVARQLRPPFWRGLWAHHLLAGYAVVDDRGAAAGSHGQELRRPLFKGALCGRTLGFNGVLVALWWTADELPAGRPRGRLRPRRVSVFIVMPTAAALT